MAGTDDREKAQKDGASSQEARDFSAGMVTRTLPSLDLEALRALHEQNAKGGKRPGIVSLTDDLEKDEEPTSEVPPHIAAERESAREVSEAVARREILPSSPQVSAAAAEAVAAPSGLDRLLEALADETFPPDTPEYLSTSGDPFNGMMGATLELKIDGSLFGNAAKGVSNSNLDADLAWLSPEEAAAPRLPNSFGLGDEQVSQACLPMFQGLGAVKDETLIAVGMLARLEARIVDSFVQVGLAYAELATVSAQPGHEALLALLGPIGVLADSELLQAVRLWRENKHDAKFWADDDGSRLKPVRLVGAYLLRKRGEPLSRLTRPPSVNSPALAELLRLVDLVRNQLNERQAVIRKYFTAQSNLFATSFLVQRGLNARPGFFWREPVREEL